MPRPTFDEVRLRQVRELAKRSTCARRNVACILTNIDNRIIGEGYNGVAVGAPHCSEGHLCKGATLPSGTGLDSCNAIHAEQNALVNCKEPENVYTCYVSSSPCISCIKLLLATSCRRIVFEEEYPHPEAKELWVSGLNYNKFINRMEIKEWKKMILE